ncbi:PHB depolymerase family esterase [Roseomonas sp. E05]|uniref:alpha/beta hydrolase n=1 Tax=Roseomonas sp. E05 TaxID=3046310 RepID=UPI0024BAB43F|nr:alpha/beta hydrolase-fold protein [Roseomonas sp. E05]MDJ0389523.1 PHB depolymerase family esterase [Roseomonas sp. E05]
MSTDAADPASAARGRLLARPRPSPEAPPLAPGLHGLGLGRQRDGFLRVPEGAAAAELPLVVMLHGAGGHAAGALRLIEQAAPGVLLLVPESRAATWDVILGGYGPDVAFLDAALREVFQRHRVDPRRVALAGFSDGASYALSLALGNGDLFTHALAFSPGFVASPPPLGRPAFFVSHGVADDVLPIDACSRRIVPRLRKQGYAVEYREFAGGHSVPEDLAGEAVRRVVDG